MGRSANDRAGARTSGRACGQFVGTVLLASAPVSTAAGDRAFGEYLSGECVACHRLSGGFAGIPPIVGWPAAAFVEIMGEYRAGKRENPIMRAIAERLSAEEIAALAAYFGSLPAQRRQQ